MPLVDQKEEWWVTVMGVGLNPELTKWSVCSGSAIVLTRMGYKEYHWLVIPHQPLRLLLTSPTLSCLLIAVLHLPVSSPALSIIWGLAALLFMFVVRLDPTLTRVMPSLPSCCECASCYAPTNRPRTVPKF